MSRGLGAAQREALRLLENSRGAIDSVDLVDHLGITPRRARMLLHSLADRGLGLLARGLSYWGHEEGPVRLYTPEAYERMLRNALADAGGSPYRQKVIAERLASAGLTVPPTSRAPGGTLRDSPDDR